MSLTVRRHFRAINIACHDNPRSSLRPRTIMTRSFRLPFPSIKITLQLIKHHPRILSSLFAEFQLMQFPDTSTGFDGGVRVSHPIFIDVAWEVVRREEYVQSRITGLFRMRLGFLFPSIKLPLEGKTGAD